MRRTRRRREQRRGRAGVFARGPEAADYGAASGFPLGTQATASQPEHLGGDLQPFRRTVPSRPVKRAATPWQFKRASEPAISYTFKSERFSIADYLARNPATGLLIAKDDTILYEHYQYARTDSDRFLSQSMAKTITAMLVGIAIAENKIRSIDDPVSAYVPGLPTPNTAARRCGRCCICRRASRFRKNYDGADDVARLGRDLFLAPGKDPVASVAQFTPASRRRKPNGTMRARRRKFWAGVARRGRSAGRGLSRRADLAADRHRGRRIMGHRRHRTGNNLLLLQRRACATMRARPAARL